MKRTLITLLFLLCVIPIHAQTDTPKIVLDGLAAYQKSGGKEAVSIWLKGSPIESDVSSRMSMSGGLVQFETAYGKMIGFEPLRVASISPSVRLVYVLLKYEKGPVYGRFDCYKANSNWIIPQLNLNVKADTILPSDMLAGTR